VTARRSGVLARRHPSRPSLTEILEGLADVDGVVARHIDHMWDARTDRGLGFR